MSSNPEDIICHAEAYDQRTTEASASLLCDGYKLTGNFTLAEIAHFIRAKRDAHAGHTLFATLDNIWQAAYTSMHTTITHDLDDTDGHDLTRLPPDAFEEHQGRLEHKGYLTLKDEFPIRYKNFMAKAKKESSDYLKGQLLWNEDSEHCEGSIITTMDLKSRPREETCFVQIVPVTSTPEALAAYPNGYFHGDYTPFQNYVLAQILLSDFGCTLFGIGASYLGFMCDDMLDEAMAKKLGIYLASLYRDYTSEVPLEKKIALKLAGEKEFYIAYGDR